MNRNQDWALRQQVAGPQVRARLQSNRLQKRSEQLLLIQTRISWMPLEYIQALILISVASG